MVLVNDGHDPEDLVIVSGMRLESRGNEKRERERGSEQVLHW
jgi:hypothetical protein